MKVRVDLNISLDGYATTVDRTPDNPFGDDWGRLTGAYVQTQVFRERVLHDTTGQGTTGIDNKYARHYFEAVGSEIMAAGMFGLVDHPEPDWRGWWGEEPPFHVPVFVLTHRQRDPIFFANGTSFHFISASPTEALGLAREAAQGGDVRIGGGPSTVREFLKLGLVDHLHVAIAPLLLGQGVPLWADLRHFEEGYEVVTETAESGTIHVTFQR